MSMTRHTRRLSAHDAEMAPQPPQTVHKQLLIL
jgi:hypothetical protein